MRLTGLHLLLTYQCTLECDHCFVWGSPWQSGTLTLPDIQGILRQATDLGTIEWIYFEGGEPSLYYATLLAGVRMAAEAGFRVGVVSNGYWATSVEDAVEWLRPMAGLVQDLSISSDLYHSSERVSAQARNARLAAERLDIPLGLICIAPPQATSARSVLGQLPIGESAVMYRGRAAQTLAPRALHQPWTHFTACLDEDLREPGRLHVDPFGFLHICQGLSIGNLYRRSLKEVVETYDPEGHPIIGPLLRGGPVALVRRYGLAHSETYADECHLCYEARRALRGQFPELLGPDSMYGAPTSQAAAPE